MATPVHNARAALDHLAVLIVEFHGDGNGQGHYPFKDLEVGFGDALRRALPGVSPAIRSRVKNTQPWRDGDYDLWLLHHLDIVDKHRLLVPVAAASLGIFSSIGLALPPGDEQMAGIDLLSTERHLALVDGDEVFRDQRPATQRAGDINGPFRSSIQPTFHIIFDTGTLVSGAPVVDTVAKLVGHAGEVAQALRDLVASPDVPSGRS